MPRNRRMRLVLAMVGGIVALLCLGGVGVFVAVYDNATKIDRSTPDQVVSSFLRAALVQRDDVQAKLFLCEQKPSLPPITAVRDEIVKREQQFDVRVSVSWGALIETSSAQNEKAIRTGLVIAGASNGQARSSRYEEWEFQVIDEDGWRVCGATKVS